MRRRAVVSAKNALRRMLSDSGRPIICTVGGSSEKTRSSKVEGVRSGGAMIETERRAGCEEGGSLLAHRLSAGV